MFIAYNNQASNLEWAGRSREALELTGQSLRLAPNRRVVRAGNLIRLGRLADAEREILEAARGRAPTVAEAVLLGAIELKHRRVKAAERAFDKALGSNSIPMYDLLIASYYLDTDDFEGAAKRLQHAFQSDAACVQFVADSPLFASYLKRPLLQQLLTRYSAN